MMTIVNSLCGTYGWFAKVNGVVLGLIIYIVFGNPYVSLVVTIGYVLGESFGWGDWVGCLTSNRNNYKDTTDEGKSNGIMWLSQKIVPDWRTNFIDYSRVALTIRGFYWYILTLTPLYFVGFSPYLLLGLIVFLSFGFMLSYELAYYLAPKLNIKWLDFNSGWTLGEGIVGLTQDIAILVLIGVSLWH